MNRKMWLILRYFYWDISIIIDRVGHNNLILITKRSTYCPALFTSYKVTTSDTLPGLHISMPSWCGEISVLFIGPPCTQESCVWIRTWYALSLLERIPISSVSCVISCLINLFSSSSLLIVSELSSPVSSPGNLHAGSYIEGSIIVDLRDWARLRKTGFLVIYVFGII